MDAPIICMACGNTGQIKVADLSKVAEGLELTCNACESTDVDLYDGQVVKKADTKTAAKEGVRSIVAFNFLSSENVCWFCQKAASIVDGSTTLTPIVVDGKETAFRYHDACAALAEVKPEQFSLYASKHATTWPEGPFRLLGPNDAMRLENYERPYKPENHGDPEAASDASQKIAFYSETADSYREFIHTYHALTGEHFDWNGKSHQVRGLWAKGVEFLESVGLIAQRMTGRAYSHMELMLAHDAGLQATMASKVAKLTEIAINEGASPHIALSVAKEIAKTAEEHPIPLHEWNKYCHCGHKGSEHWGDGVFGGSTSCRTCAETLSERAQCKEFRPDGATVAAKTAEFPPKKEEAPAEAPAVEKEKNPFVKEEEVPEEGAEGGVPETAQFASTCSDCGGPINPGEEIFYNPTAQQAMCITNGCAERAWDAANGTPTDEENFPGAEEAVPEAPAEEAPFPPKKASAEKCSNCGKEEEGLTPLGGVGEDRKFCRKCLSDRNSDRAASRIVPTAMVKVALSNLEAFSEEALRNLLSSMKREVEYGIRDADDPEIAELDAYLATGFYVPDHEHTEDCPTCNRTLVPVASKDA